MNRSLLHARARCRRRRWFHVIRDFKIYDVVVNENASKQRERGSLRNEDDDGCEDFI